MDFWVLVWLVIIFQLLMGLIGVLAGRVSSLWTVMWESSLNTAYGLREVGRGLALTFFMVVCIVAGFGVIIVLQVIVAEYSFLEAIFVYIALQLIFKAVVPFLVRTDDKNDDPSH